jgi:hypothetical protein
MKPNPFTKLTQRGLSLFGQIVLIIIAIATIFAVIQEMLKMLGSIGWLSMQ